MKLKKWLLFTVFFIQTAFAQKSENTYLLIHGAWHGAWCWNMLLPMLQEKGLKAIAIDLPGHGKDSANIDNITLNDYVEAVVNTAKQIKGNIILVGHSMGGIVISQAAEKLGTQKVSKLVYLDAFLPKPGESVSSIAILIESSLPKDSSRISIGQGLIVSANGKSSRFKNDIADLLFYHDCSTSIKQFAHEHLTKQAFSPLSTPVRLSDDIFGKIPKYYILCNQSKDLDKSILPTRVECQKVYKINSSHSPFFSQPKELANILFKLR